MQGDENVNLLSLLLQDYLEVYVRYGVTLKKNWLFSFCR